MTWEVRWRRGGRLTNEGCVYNYGWCSLYGRNQHNTVNINKKLKLKEKKYSDNKTELPSEIYFKNTYLGISLLWKWTDLYYFSWKPLFRGHGMSWIEKYMLEVLLLAASTLNFLNYQERQLGLKVYYCSCISCSPCFLGLKVYYCSCISCSPCFLSWSREQRKETIHLIL